MTPETLPCIISAVRDNIKNAGAVSQTFLFKKEKKLFFLKSSSSIACALKASWFLFWI